MVKWRNRFWSAELIGTARASSSSRLPAAITTVSGWNVKGPTRCSRMI